MSIEKILVEKNIEKKRLNQKNQNLKNFHQHFFFDPKIFLIFFSIEKK